MYTYTGVMLHFLLSGSHEAFMLVVLSGLAVWLEERTCVMGCYLNLGQLTGIVVLCCFGK
jgi:hypothetical protein